MHIYVQLDYINTFLQKLFCCYLWSYMLTFHLPTLNTNITDKIIYFSVNSLFHILHYTLLVCQLWKRQVLYAISLSNFSPFVSTQQSVTDFSCSECWGLEICLLKLDLFTVLIVTNSGNLRADEEESQQTGSV